MSISWPRASASRLPDLSGWRLQRSGELDLDPGTLATRAKAFAAALPSGRGALLVVRDAEEMRSYLLTAPGPAGEIAADHLGAATAARPEPTELTTLDLGCAVHGRLRFRRRAAAVRDTQVGADMAGLAQVLARAMHPGSWVLVRLRAPRGREEKRWSRWLSHRLGAGVPQHHSMQTGAMVMAVDAGGDDREQVASLLAQVAAAMPGFDMPVRAGVRSRTRPLAQLGVAGLGLAAVAYLLAPAWVAYGALAATVAVCAIASSRIRTGLDAASAMALISVPVPRRTGPPPKSPTAERTGEHPRASADGEYPLSPYAFMVGAPVVVGLAAPQAGATSGATTTSRRPVPAPVTARIGPLVGTGAGGAPVHLSAADSWAGTAIVGRAGSGKSLLVHSLFAWHMLERLAPCALPGAPGASCSLVAFEAKPDGALSYLRWSAAIGDEVLLVDVADPATYAIDLLPASGTATQRARDFTNALQYAFDDGAIQARSFETLTQVVTAALVVTDAVALAAELPTGRGPMFYAHVLLGGLGDSAAALLAGAVRSEAVRLEASGAGDADLSAARDALAPLFDGMTPAARRQFVDAPRNKIGPLLALDSWWLPDRPKVTWRQVLEAHGAVVVNTGASPTTGAQIDAQLVGQLQSLLMFTLRTEIMRTCAGWQAQGRSVAIFADELSLLAGSSPEVITWLRDQGRSYGVRPVFATQYPEQLDPKVRAAFLGFSCLLALAQDNAQIASEVATDLGADGSTWSASDIVTLPPYTATARLNVGQQRVSAFTVALANFEADMADFPRAQGYVPGEDGGLAPVTR